MKDNDETMWGADFTDEDDYVAYVAYGSNMCEERFHKYLLGGKLEFIDGEGNCQYKTYTGCNNKDLPIKQYRCKIPYKRFFAKSSSIWDNKGVAFLDPRESKSGDETLCRVYIIELSQLSDIADQEGSWYNRIQEIGTVGDYRAFTITTSKKEEELAAEYNIPSQRYLDVIAKGEKECEMLEEIEFDGGVACYDEETGEKCWICKEYR